MKNKKIIDPAPDPLNIGMFTYYQYEETIVKPQPTRRILVTCSWCKSKYSDARESCPSCGGPRQ